jgi:hypothetical protein
MPVHLLAHHTSRTTQTMYLFAFVVNRVCQLALKKTMISECNAYPPSFFW